MNQRRKSQRVRRDSMLPPKKVERERMLREHFQKERPTLDELVRSGEYSEPVRQGEYFDIAELMASFREARRQKSLSLSDWASLSGMDKAMLSRLENGVAENPTYLTLQRMARSLGKRLRIVLEDRPAN